MRIPNYFIKNTDSEVDKVGKPQIGNKKDERGGQMCDGISIDAEGQA